jgi:muconate cycloisomerase
MKIVAIRTKPVSLDVKQPYVWAQGVREAAVLVLIEIEGDDGSVGIGECVTSPNYATTVDIVQTVTSDWVGRSPFDVSELLRRAEQEHFAAQGASTPRFVQRVLAGLDMALWDLMGKNTGQPVHDLLGGSVHEAVTYFAFLQGESIDELSASAESAIATGSPVIYLKIGRGEAMDLNVVAAVREVIGDRRLRLDPNEAWDTLTAIRMIRKLERFEPEYIEQPTPSGSIAALAHVKKSVGVPIGADQCVYTINDVYEVCRQQAADLIVLGLHEIGGIIPFKKAAAIAEAAGINICIHGVFETGITTCASYHAACTIPNLDDGNQIMWQLLSNDVVASPSLVPVDGKLSLAPQPGLGFQLDESVVEASTCD